MYKPIKFLGSGFGLLASLAGLTAFAFWQAPAKEPSASTPSVVSTSTTTTAAPETPTSVTNVQASPVRKKRSVPSTSSTLATIPQYLVDRIPGPATDLIAERDGLGEETTSTSALDTPSGE